MRKAGTSITQYIFSESVVQLSSNAVFNVNKRPEVVLTVEKLFIEAKTLVNPLKVREKGKHFDENRKCQC